MTSTAVDPYRKTAEAARGDPQWTPRRVGQIVAAQAAIAGLLAALGHGPIILTAACTIGCMVVIVAFARVRGRWLHSWLAIGIRYATRRHSLPANATPAELMRFLAPDVAPAPDGAFVDADGLVAVFELDGPLLASEPTALPDLGLLMVAANDPRLGHNLSAIHEPIPSHHPRGAHPSHNPAGGYGPPQGHNWSAAHDPNPGHSWSPAHDPNPGHNWSPAHDPNPGHNWSPAHDPNPGHNWSATHEPRPSRNPAVAQDPAGHNWSATHEPRPSRNPAVAQDPAARDWSATHEPRPSRNPAVAHDPAARDWSAADDPPPEQHPRTVTALPEIRPLVRIDLLLTAAAVRTSGIGSATAVSYRQLTGGRIPAQCRTFVVLRVLRPPGWSDADLRPTMSAATRRVAKRLGPHRRLGHEDAATTLAELAHHDFTSRVDERWTFVEIGGLCQAAYRVTLPAGNEDTARAMHRLLTLPTAAIAICVSPRRFAPSLAVRLAAESPQQLERADQALRQLAAAERATVHRLDGEHRIAAAETLLVGGRSGSLGIRPSDTTAACRGDPAGGAASSRPPDERQHVARPDATRPRPRPSPRPRRPQPTPQPYAGSWPQTVSGGAALPLAGLVLGYDRHGIPVVAKIFRPAPTRIVVVAGLRTAQLVAIRALALGAQVDVRTRRWAAWSGFADEVTAPTRNIVVTPDAAAIPDWASPSLNGGMPTRMASTTPPGTPLRPTLTIVDAATRGLRPANGPGTDRPADQGSATPPGNTRGWHATIIVRDELTSADTPLLTTADLVMLQNLRPGEANLVADTFALEGQLTGLGDEIVAMIATGQPLRWAALAPTPVERSLTDQGTPSDVDALQPVTRAGNSLRGGD